MKIPKKGQSIAIAFYPNIMVHCKVTEVVETEPGLNGARTGILFGMILL